MNADAAAMTQASSLPSCLRRPRRSVDPRQICDDSIHNAIPFHRGEGLDVQESVSGTGAASFSSAAITRIPYLLMREKKKTHTLV